MNGTSSKSYDKAENDKAPDLNGTPLNAFKSMNNHDLRTLFVQIQDFWDNKTDLDEWCEDQVTPISKKGDLEDPNKWRGVNLIDIGSKVFGSILCERLFTIIHKHSAR